jgi:predicted DNA-binding transcriptional regulator AlpA
MTKSKLADNLAYPPRAMRADRAAAYLSMSTSNFHRLVEEGLMPKAVKIKGIVTWDRLELDVAFDSFKNDDEGGNNTMHKLLAIRPGR